jgi:hypothetical protein
MSPITLEKNIALTDVDTGGQTSSVGEPTVASNGPEIFFAGNWYATKSVDDGATWSFVDPFRLLPEAGSEFCCDAIILYEPTHNLLFWLLQYSEDQHGENVLRLAVKAGGTLGDDSWYWWDFKPSQTNAQWAGQWFDYPDLELGDNFLYMTTNVFKGEKWTRSVVFRLPLPILANRGQLKYRYWSSAELFSLRCVRGARSTMYFASHAGNNHVKIYSWPEAENAPTAHDVTVSAWNAGSFSAPGPDGTNWLARCDPRITGAWLSKGKIGLAWNANRRGAARPFPYVRIVEVDANGFHVVADRDIWSPNYAYAYPNGAPNAAGRVGITLFRGGNQIHPSHVVGVFDDAANRWVLRATKNGTHGPVDNKWGDYITCRRNAPNGQSWIASGYTLQGGGTRDDIQPRFVRFTG